MSESARVVGIPRAESAGNLSVVCPRVSCRVSYLLRPHIHGYLTGGQLCHLRNANRVFCLLLSVAAHTAYLSPGWHIRID